MSSKNRGHLLSQWKEKRQAQPSKCILIANTGNIDGRNPERENTLLYLQEALNHGYHVCADILYTHGAFCLIGHDRLHHVFPAFLANQKVWSRAADAITLDALCSLGAHAVPNITAGITFTTAQFIWTLPGELLSPRSVAVLPETAPPNWIGGVDIAGMCSDYPQNYR